MDTLKNQLEQIQKNLASLNATQKMLVGTLIALILVTLFWYAHYAGTAEMVAVWSTPVSDTDMARMTGALDNAGITYKVQDGKLMVPAEERAHALGQIGFAEALPQQSSSGFDQMAAKWGLWDTPSRSDQMDNRAKEITLNNIIGQFPGVSNAVVMLAPTTYRRIGDTSVGSASVNITRKDGSANAKHLAAAAAAMVRGAIPGLKTPDINIVVDGTPLLLKDDSDLGGGGDSQLDTISTNREYYRKCIIEQYPYVTGLVASVNGKLNTEDADTHTMAYDQANTLSLATQTQSTQSDNSSAAPTSQEPGAQPNVGQSIAPGGGAGGTTNSDSTESATNSILPSFKDTKSHKPAGEFLVTQASVRIPESFFADSLKDRLKHDPSQAELAEYVKAQLDEVRQEVQRVTGIDQPGNVFVGTYPSAGSSATTGPAISAAATTGVTSMVNAWGKQAAVGALALVSLFMVSSMVKKSAPAPIIPVAATMAEPRGPITLGGTEMIAGMVAEGGATLNGMELDDEAVQTQQILEQVSSLVGETPDAAANIVKRWMNRS